jgi:hypothetical protein
MNLIDYLLRKAPKIAICACLLYSTYLVVKCPCETLLCCSRNEFVASIGIVLLTWWSETSDWL